MAFYNEISNGRNIIISFTKNPKNDFGIFAKGYSRSANLLAQIFLSKYGNSDYDGYPIIFLYRHSFELHLKNIIYKTVKLSELKDIEISEKELKTGHELDKLATVATKSLLKNFPDNDYLITICTKIKKMADEFNEIDPSSFCYRYPVNLKGEHSTKNNQVVNIEAIYDNFSAFLSELETINFGLDVEKNQTQEIFENIENFNKEQFCN